MLLLWFIWQNRNHILVFKLLYHQTSASCCLISSTLSIVLLLMNMLLCDYQHLVINGFQLLAVGAQDKWTLKSFALQHLTVRMPDTLAEIQNCHLLCVWWYNRVSHQYCLLNVTSSLHDRLRTAPMFTMWCSAKAQYLLSSCVSLSQAGTGILSTHLNLLSHKQCYTIAQGFLWHSNGWPLPGGEGGKYRWGRLKLTIFDQYIAVSQK